MWCKLKEDTVALRVSSAPTTQPGLPFGMLGLWFTRKPRLLIVGKGINHREARALCEQHELTTEQLARLSPGARCSASTREPGAPEPAPTPAGSAGKPHPSARKRRAKKR